jgi:hypothetical protein
MREAGGLRKSIKCAQMGIAPPCGAGARPLTPGAWRACRSTGPRGHRGGCPRRWCRRSRRGCKPARRGVGVIGRTGPTKHWRRLSISPREAPCSGRPCGTCVSARPSGRTGPPRAIGAAPPQSNGWRRKHWRREKTSPGRGVRAAESRRGPLSPGAHVTGHVGRQGPSPHRRPVGEPGPGRVLCRPPGGDGAAAHPPAGAARAQHSQDGAEPTAARASGVCGPPPGDRPGLSGQDVSRGPHHE